MIPPLGAHQYLLSTCVRQLIYSQLTTMTSLLKLAFLTVVVAMVTMSEAATTTSEQEAILDLLEV